MKQISSFILASTLVASATAAQAQPLGDPYHYTNGGTGFIGLTDSAGTPRRAQTQSWTTGSVSGVPLQAGEASTMVNGRPNQHPATAAAMQAGVDTRTMGSSATAPQSRQWPHVTGGTPK